MVCVSTQWCFVLFYTAKPCKTWGAESCFPVVYTVVVCAHTVVMYVVLCGWSFLTVVLQNLRNGCVVEKVCPQSGCACWFSGSGLMFLRSGSVLP